MAASLGLGSAQFGGDYGISNTRGRVGEDEVRQIHELAADCGRELNVLCRHPFSEGAETIEHILLEITVAP